jgi:hypothetical protein
VLKTLTKLIVMLLACYVMVEMTYRLYAAGPAALHPAKFNSMNMLLLSGLVQESEYPEVYYELKPNLDTWFQGVRFRTNSAGLADLDYPVEKQANDFRVAVIGSSWTMPTGVAASGAYHSVLEDDLSELENGINYEFINFAVEYYGLREQVATARLRAMEWSPDLIVFAITPFTATLRWNDSALNEPLPEQTYPLFSSYSLRELDRALKTKYFRPGLLSRLMVDYDAEDEMHGQLQRAIGELEALSAEKDIPVVIMWLGSFKPSAETLEVLLQACKEADMLFVDGYTVVSGSGGAGWKYRASRFDRHPNGEAHRMIADHLKQALQKNNLLPGV